MIHMSESGSDSDTDTMAKNIIEKNKTTKSKKPDGRKKPRSEAQIAATKRLVELRRKQREDAKQKKEDDLRKKYSSKPKSKKTDRSSSRLIAMPEAPADCAIFEKNTFRIIFIFCCTLNSFSIKSYIQKTEGCRPAFGQTRDHIVQNKDSITIRFLIVNANKRSGPFSHLTVTFD